MAWGILANAVTTALAAAAYGAAAVAAQRRQTSLGRGTSSAPVLFDIITVYLSIAALRQLAAWASQSDPAFVEADRLLYLMVLVPAAVVIVPHVHLVSLVVWGRARVAAGLALGFAAVVAIGLVFAYAEGIEGPTTSDYGTDWSMRSVVTQAILLAFIMLPGLVGSIALAVLAGRLEGEGKRRVRLIGVSSLVYFAVFTADAFGLTGLPLLAARLATAGTGVVAWLAYQPKRGKPAVYAPPPEDPKDALYER